MFRVTAVTTEERADWERLFLGYADFYRVSVTTDVVDAVWSWIFDDSVPFYCLVARTEQGELVGLAHVWAMPSPLLGKMVGFLHDLYVTPEYRGEGTVDAIFSALTADAREKGWSFIRWITKDDNYRARAAYDRFAVRTHWITYQLDLDTEE